MKRLLVATCLAALAAAAPAAAATPTYKGSVGPGFTIKLAKPTKAGKAKIVVADKSSSHNFHLTGPGVNKKTGVAFTGTVTWAVMLRKGAYTFRSDTHPSLRGTLNVS